MNLRSFELKKKNLLGFFLHKTNISEYYSDYYN